MESNTLQIALTVVCAIGALGQVIIGLMISRIGKAETKADKVDEAQSANERVLAALEAITARLEGRGSKTEDRAQGQGETLAGIAARLAQVERDAGKCDTLGARVSVLEEFKGETQRQNRNTDEAMRAIVQMAEQIKTLFKRVDELATAVSRGFNAPAGQSEADEIIESLRTLLERGAPARN